MRDAVNKVRWITVDVRGDGQRIDNFLLRELKGVPRALIYRLLRKGEVRVNKGRAKPHRRLQQGDVVRIPPLRMADEAALAMPPAAWLQRLEARILHENTGFLVLNKPAGMAVHGGSGIRLGVIEALRLSRPQMRALELAHRLDRDTSGCLLIAKKRSALREFQRLQQAGKVEKRYWALLSGHWHDDHARVQAPLKKNVLRSGERIVRVDPRGKSADTEFRVLARFAKATLVEARLHTGRTHQIRVHAQYLGTPILGDEKYGHEAANADFRRLGLKRLFLHARSLAFPWPETRNTQRFQAPLDKELQRLLERLHV